MSAFRDHFSIVAGGYAESRPRYGPALFRWAMAKAPGDMVWDCATGSGQAALAWANAGGSVIATDASAAQVANAMPHPRVSYAVGTAEDSGLAAASMDVVCVAQALHWFDRPVFYREAARVLRPRGLLVLVTYAHCEVSPAVDALVRTLAFSTLAADWPEGRDLVESRYVGILPRWPAVATPRFELTADWQATQLADYLGTWSANARHFARTGVDAAAAIAPLLQAEWGPTRRRVRWPLSVYVFRRP
ncbi:MAG: class I SAM-dependent methyltransferase [Pseudomonadota bacterium]